MAIKGTINLAAMIVNRQQIIGCVLRPRVAAEKASLIEKFTEQFLPIQGKLK